MSSGGGLGVFWVWLGVVWWLYGNGLGLGLGAWSGLGLGWAQAGPGPGLGAEPGHGNLRSFSDRRLAPKPAAATTIAATTASSRSQQTKVILGSEKVSLGALGGAWVTQLINRVISFRDLILSENDDRPKKCILANHPHEKLDLIYFEVHF